MKINQLGSGRAYYEIVGDDGQKYVYVPEEFVQKGFVSGKSQFYDPVFTDKKDEVLSKASSFTLPKGLSVNSAASKLYSEPSKGVIWKAEDFAPYSDKGTYSFSTYNISDKSPAIKSLATVNGKTVYATNASKGYDSTYLNGSSKAGEASFTNITKGKSGGGGLLGGFVGGLVNPVLETVGDALIKAGPALQLANFAVPGLGTGLAAGTALGQGDITGAALNAGIGELTGNSMVTPGGGTPIWATPSSTPTGNLAPVVDAGGPTEILSGTGGATGGLMGGAGGITAGSSGVGLTGAGASAYGGLGAGLGEATAAGGIGGSAIGGLGLTAGAGAAYGGLGAGLGTSAAAMGTGSLLGTGAAAGGAATGAAGALTASELAKAGLIQGGLGLVGGLLQGNTAQNALEADAAARAKLAAEVRDMGKFQPVGTTTRFGTSSFTTDPTTGAITPSYSLSPEALAYQNSLSALGTQGLQGAQTMMNLGNQYINESPEAVRNRYIATQTALLAPGQENTLANLRTNLTNTGRGGLAFGATSDGMAATNPELAAYYNSLAMTNRGIAADAETQYQNQVNFGTGLMGGATTPFSNVFTAQKAVEAMGQQPLAMSTDFANTVATRGAAQGANYATAMNPSLQSSYNAANYNPWATAIQGAASNPLVGQGLLNAWK